MTTHLGHRKKTSLVAVGRSGSGKSSIGNVFLGSDKHWEGPFATGVTQDSCTISASVMRNHDNTRVYTDLPGIPDTNPDMTAEFYDVCINELKKPHTAVLFVFQFTKIDVEDFKLAELLFREMNKAHCEKILVINDQSRYFGNRPSMKDYQTLANEIISYTKLNFSAVYVIDDVANMKTRLEEIERGLEGVETLSSPELKNFQELGAWIDTLKEEEDFRQEAMKELKNALRIKKGTVAFNCLGLATIITQTVLLAPTGIGMIIAPIVIGAAGEVTLKSVKEYREQRPLVKQDIAENKDVLDRIVKELMEAKAHHRELRNKLKGEYYEHHWEYQEGPSKERKHKFWKKTPFKKHE